MKPLWHRLQEGGLGEVVAAEMLQGVVDFQHAAVDAILKDHSLDWRGLPEHAGLRWARASAFIEILEGDLQTPLDEPRTRVHFAKGFAEPPRIRGGKRTIHGTSYLGWWLNWKLDEPGRQYIHAGYALRRGGVGLPSVMFVQDLAAGGASSDDELRNADDEGRGRIFLGRYESFQVEEDVAYRLSPELQNIRAVSLLIR